MRKITFLYLVAFSINSFASDNTDCHSTDPELGDSAQWASKAIDLFAKNKHAQSIKTVDACFKLFSPAAVVMQKDLNAKNMKAPPVGKVNFKEKKKIDANWAVNDVSVALWAKARSHEKMGDIDLALARTAGISGLNSYYALDKIADFPYARVAETPEF